MIGGTGVIRHSWGTGNGPYRVVVGDNATVAIVKKNGQVIHYVFRAKPISIAMTGGGAPKWYSWTKPMNRFKHTGLAIIHDRWYKKCERAVVGSDAKLG